MDLSLVIVHYKAPDLLEQCIKSITAKYPELRGHFVIVDNSPEKATRQRIKKTFPNERYIPSRKNVGFAKAINWGIYNSQSKYILILNQDIIMRDEAVQKMYDYLEKYQDAALCAPKLIYTDGSIQDSCCRFYTPWVIVYRRTWFGRLPFAKKSIEIFTMADYDHQTTKDVDWVTGAAMMIRRAAVEKVGPMDERFFFYFEDVDWCRRFWESGWRITYLPEAQMTHYHSRESAEKTGFWSLTKKMTRVHIKSGVKYFIKYRKHKEAPRDIFNKTQGQSEKLIKPQS